MFDMKSFYAAVGGLFVLALLGACSEVVAPGASSAPAAREVDVYALEPQRVAVFSTLPGRTKAYRVAQVRPQVSGVIRQRSFEEGSQVRAGQTLYQLDDQVYAAGLNQVRAELDKAQASRDLASLNLARIKDVVAQGAVSQQEYDQARAGFAQAEADVALARARLQAAEVDLAYTRIEAPIEGRVGRSFVTEGALVTANQVGELTQVTQLDPIYVDIPRSSSELRALKRALSEGSLLEGPGQAEVQLVLDDGSRYGHTGRLQFSDVTVDPDTGSVTLRAKFPNPEHVLLPGMFVQARVLEGVREQALLLPQQAVARDRQGEASVLLLENDNSVGRRAVVLGRAMEGFWLVDEGLQEGDRVLLTGHQRVRPGDVVSPVLTDLGQAQAARSAAVRVHGDEHG